MKTREEVEQLKRDWSTDPCWDIYTTEGFEEYESELIAFQQAEQDRWARIIRDREARVMERYGVSLEMAKYILLQEQEMAELRKRIGELEERP